MKKIGIITIVVLAFAAVASAAPQNTTKSTKQWGHHQCVPEPLSMLALIPGVGMLIRRRNKRA